MGTDNACLAELLGLKVMWVTAWEGEGNENGATASVMLRNGSMLGLQGQRRLRLVLHSGLHLIEKPVYLQEPRKWPDGVVLNWNEKQNSFLLFLLRTPNQFTHHGRALWQNIQLILFWCFKGNTFSCCEASELFIILGKHYAFFLHFAFAYLCLLSRMSFPCIRDTNVSA